MADNPGTSRRKKSARERRQQRQRATNRMMQTMLRGCLDLQNHRGNSLSHVGMLVMKGLKVILEVPAADTVPWPRFAGTELLGAPDGGVPPTRSSQSSDAPPKPFSWGSFSHEELSVKFCTKAF